MFSPQRMQTATVTEVARNLSGFVSQIQRGRQPVRLTRAGKPVADLVPCSNGGRWPEDFSRLLAGAGSLASGRRREEDPRAVFRQAIRRKHESAHR